MKKLFAILLTLFLLIPSALAVEVTDWESLEAALTDPAVDAITVTAPMAIPSGVSCALDKSLTIQAPEGVLDFLIESGASLVLAEGAAIATVSNFGEGFFLSRIDVRGTLDAGLGSIAPGTFLALELGGELRLPENASDIVVDHMAADVEGLLAAAEDPFCGAILFQDDPEIEGGAQLVVDRPVELNHALYVTANRGFTSLRVVDGGALRLGEGGELGTMSTIDFENGIFAIGQIWLDGGTLEAAQGVILPQSTVYVTGGELNLPENLEDVAVIGGATTEEALLAFLADERFTEVFVQGDITLTSDVVVNRYLRVQDGATLAVQGCTLTVAEGARLEVFGGSAIDNQGTIVNSGEIHIEADAAFSGNEPEGEGAFMRD